MNDNGNVLFEILLLPGKLLYLAIWKSPLLQIILSEDLYVANQNIPLNTCINRVQFRRHGLLKGFQFKN